MNMTEIDAAFELALEASQIASQTIRTTRPASTRTKENPADLVTEVDVSIERRVRELIAERYPEHSVDGEELGGSHGSAPYTWYLDPIDGTTNYVNGLPWSSFSVALADKHGPLLGVVTDPFRDETTSAIRGRGATCDGRAVRCSDARSVAGTTVMTEWSGHRPWPGMLDTMTAVSASYGTVRIMGSSALAITAVALGRAAGTIIGSYHAVDDIAGVLIAREAGAVVQGRNRATPDERGVLVAAPGVVHELERLWR